MATESKRKPNPESDAALQTLLDAMEYDERWFNIIGRAAMRAYLPAMTGAGAAEILSAIRERLVELAADETKSRK